MMEIDQAKIEKAIVQEAVRGIINDDDLYGRVKHGIDERIDKIFAETVSVQVSSAVETIVKEGFERSYIKRDGFGKPVGEPTSISKELEKIITGYWTASVGQDGKEKSGGFNTVSRAEWMMAKLCADDFSKEMKQHIVNVGGALKDHFRGVLNQHITSMLSEVFHVQTTEDKAIKAGGPTYADKPAGPIGS